MSNRKQDNGDCLDRFRELGYAIAYYRKRSGLTQEKLAEKLGISRQHLAAIEAPNVDRWPSLDLIFAISDELQIEPFVLFKFGPER